MQQEHQLSFKVKVPGVVWYLGIAFFLFLSNPKGDQALKNHIRRQEGALKMIRNVDSVNLLICSVGSARVGFFNPEDKIYLGVCGTFIEIGS